VTASGLVSFTLGCAAVVEDIARRRVSNWTSGAALASGLVLHYAEQGWRGAAAAATGAALGFAVFLVFYLLNGMGGGDVKLMAGFGSLLGPDAILCAAWIAAVVGGLMATAHAASLSLCPGSKNARGFTRTDAIPYAPAIVLGVWLAELARG
jgi:prepilin peptidase CpaA